MGAVEGSRRVCIRSVTVTIPHRFWFVFSTGRQLIFLLLSFSAVSAREEFSVMHRGSHFMMCASGVSMPNVFDGTLKRLSRNFFCLEACRVSAYGRRLRMSRSETMPTRLLLSLVISTCLKQFFFSSLIACSSVSSRPRHNGGLVIMFLAVRSVHALRAVAWFGSLDGVVSRVWESLCTAVSKVISSFRILVVVMIPTSLVSSITGIMSM